MVFAGQQPTVRNRHKVATPTNRSKVPRLAVIIVLDQFRADYISRFGHLLGPRGLRRLIQQGAHFTNTNYEYATTYTAVGHTTITTGTLPYVHGIIANKWYIRETGRVRNSMADSRYSGVGGKNGTSPVNLLTTTLGDQLQLSNNYQSKSIGVSLKDRSAMMLAGKHGAAYWFDNPTGNFVTSSYYATQLPAWVQAVNQQRPADKYFQKAWERKLPLTAYDISDQDDAPYESSWPNKSPKFPYVLEGNGKFDEEYYHRFTETPFANDVLVDFALRAVDQEQLGKDEHPDLLGVSFSTPDLAGHLFGPYSQEMQDMVLRLDDSIATLLDNLDRRLGLENLVIAVSADHGVVPIPEYSQAHKLGGRRIIGTEMLRELEKGLVMRFGKLPEDPQANNKEAREGRYILCLVNHNLYLNETAIAAKGMAIAEIEDFVGRYASTKIPGIANYFTRTAILQRQIVDTLISRRVAAGFHKDRSGNVFLLVEPFTLIAEDELELSGTDHGTPYHYDTHVPLILYGHNIKPGQYAIASSPTDIAPTLANILQIEPPNGCQGRVLSEALQH
jgi:predicted AlkP superfamily pyrophosphatase or phosphodiesterase